MNADQNDKNKVVKNYLKSFEEGKEFVPPSIDIVVDGQLDLNNIALLNTYLDASNDAFVRENIIHLLVDLGIQYNRRYADGVESIQNKSVLDVLAITALKNPGMAREVSIDALRKLVRQEDLIQYAPHIKKALQESPSDGLLLLVAKTKYPDAKLEIENSAELKAYKDKEVYKITMAAIGDNKIVDDYVDSLKVAADERNLEMFSHLLGNLSLIGTDKALKTIGEYLRTDLIIDVPGAYKKSLRLNVLEALLYNYPDQWFFYPNNIIEEEDYTAAEEFCIKKFDIHFDKAPPPFMTYGGYPIPVAK